MLLVAAISKYCQRIFNTKCPPHHHQMFVPRIYFWNFSSSSFNGTHPILWIWSRIWPPDISKNWAQTLDIILEHIIITWWIHFRFLCMKLSKNYLRSNKLRGPAKHLDSCARFELLGRPKVDDLHCCVVLLRAHHVLRLKEWFFEEEGGGFYIEVRGLVRLQRTSTGAERFQPESAEPFLLTESPLYRWNVCWGKCWKAKPSNKYNP